MLRVLQDERPERPENAEARGFSDSLWSIIQECWDKEPSVRPRCRDIINLITAPGDQPLVVALEDPKISMTAVDSQTPVNQRYVSLDGKIDDRSPM